MADFRREALLHFFDTSKRPLGTLKIYGEKGTAIQVLQQKESMDFNEEPIQLLEGSVYEYELINSRAGLQLRESSVVTRSRIANKSTDAGRLKMGSYTGVLQLILEDELGNSIGVSAVEVRSSKLTYREDYRRMLDHIGEKCSDLLLDMFAPMQVRVVPDPGKDPETLYQRFAFIKSIIESKDFKDAIQRILTVPHSSLKGDYHDCDIRRGFKADGKILRQLATGPRRIDIPSSHPLYSRMKSIGIAHPTLPEKITIGYNNETIDTPENRFVKYALETFFDFISKIEKIVTRGSNQSTNRIYRDIVQLKDYLAETLSKEFFRGISKPDILPLGSPVLQRKLGYREVLRAWLKYFLAANLIWEGSEDVYGAGKRDTAKLYEYWIFFQLLDLISKRFKIDQPRTRDLIKKNKDGFSLNLKSGKEFVLEGQYLEGSRPLKIQFCYNKTFKWTESHVKQGSWSRQMRPDYTLSIWPSYFTQEEAERQELMVHIHFDAKYRVENIDELFGSDDTDLDNEKEDHKNGVYKRVDLLKMHTYRDAIRRSEGAYILYPGKRDQVWKGFHEILPGIGAFAVRPGEDGNGLGIENVSDFIKEIIVHLCNRVSKREQLSYHAFRIDNEKFSSTYFAPIPEHITNTRVREIPPSEHHVLIGEYDENVYRWIKNNNLYVINTINVTRGELKISPEFAQVKHLLLFEKGIDIKYELWRVKEIGFSLLTAQRLRDMLYPGKIINESIYPVFNIEVDKSYSDLQCDIKSILAKLGYGDDRRYFITTLNMIF